MTSKANRGKPDLNDATLQEFVDVAGLRQPVAEAIVQFRKEHGPLKDFDELVNVPGVGKATADQLRDTFSLSAKRETQTTEESGQRAADEARKAAQAGAERIATAQAQAARGVADNVAELARESQQRGAATLTRTTALGGEATATAARVGMLWVSFWPEQLGENMRVMSQLPACRSWRDLIELQTNFVRSSMRRFEERMRSTMDLMGQVGQEAHEGGREQKGRRHA